MCDGIGPSGQLCEQLRLLLFMPVLVSCQVGGSSPLSLSEMGASWRKELMRNRKRLLDRDRMTVWKDFSILSGCL